LGSKSNFKKRSVLEKDFGGVKSRKSYSSDSSVSTRRTGGSRIRHGGIGAMARVVPSSPKIITIIFIYMFLLSMTTLAFQTGARDMIAGESGFDPTTILEGSGSPILDDGGRWIDMTQPCRSGFDRSRYLSAKFKVYSWDNVRNIEEYVNYTIVKFAYNHGLTDVYERVVSDVDGIVVIRSDDDKNVFYINNTTPTGKGAILVRYLQAFETPIMRFLYGPQFEMEWIDPESMYSIGDDGSKIVNKKGWFESAGDFFGSILDGFGMLANVLSFNFYPAVALPGALIWIPFFMALPVWIYVTLLVMPLAISAVQAIGNLIPFT